MGQQTMWRRMRQGRNRLQAAGRTLALAGWLAGNDGHAGGARGPSRG